MKIKMKETVQGSLDGVTVQELVEGAEYDTVDSPRGARLAQYHVEQAGHAVYVLDAVGTFPSDASSAPTAAKDL